MAIARPVAGAEPTSVTLTNSITDTFPVFCPFSNTFVLSFTFALWCPITGSKFAALVDPISYSDLSSFISSNFASVAISVASTNATSF